MHARNAQGFLILSLLIACGHESPRGTLPTATPDASVGQRGPSCAPCQHDQECGSGNFCLSEPSGARFCAVSCVGAGDCADGEFCTEVVGASNAAIGHACRPASGSCTSVSVSPDGGVTGSENMPRPDAGAPQCTADTWNSYGWDFFSTHCASCHANYNSLAGVEADGSRIKSDLMTGRMPTNATLPQNEIGRAVRWIDCDMPR